jgi:hypothetical protein
MKPYHKAILVIICVIGLNEFGPSLYRLFTVSDKVKIGEIWMCRMPVMIMEDNRLVGEYTQTSMRKVIKVEDNIVTYVISNDTTHYKDNIKSFTFNGKGMITQKVE